MAETFKLPASSYEEIQKIIQAYANEKEGVLLPLETISHSTGIPRTSVSGNNGFLVQIGLITEGNRKAATDVGRALGRAYISKIHDEVSRIWKEIINENDFLSRMISAVRIRNGMDRSSFLNHIIYSSGLNDTKQNRTGAGAIIEIFKSVNILSDIDGKLTVIDAQEEDNNNLGYIDRSNTKEYPTPQASKVSQNNLISININISCSFNEIDNLAEKINDLIANISK